MGQSVHAEAARREFCWAERTDRVHNLHMGRGAGGPLRAGEDVRPGAEKVYANGPAGWVYTSANQHKSVCMV